MLNNPKLKTRDELKDIVAKQRSAGKVVGFTSGVFDIVHPGHVDYLSKASKLCDLLIVGLNSDESVKRNKGMERPICRDLDRAFVISGLSSVDFVFIYEEDRNNKNIETLRPDIYIKAGDYSKEKLTSAKIIEEYGGRVEIIPFVGGHSSSSVIGKIKSLAGSSEDPVQGSEVQHLIQPAVFVDRDGVINKEVEYLHEPDKFELLPGVMDGLKKLQEAGFKLIVITNQAGIGLGYFTKEAFYLVNKELLKAASKAGVKIDRVYFCPHSKADNCTCRKPLPGMLLRAVEDLNIDLSRSYCIGDKTSDIVAGEKAGCKTILVKTGHGGADKEFKVSADFVAEDLVAAANWIESHAKKGLREKKVLETGSSSSKKREETLDAIGQISGKIGHDINNLLGAIKGSVDLIRSRIGSEGKIDKQLKIIDSALAKAQALTTKIRGFVRPGPIGATSTNLKDVVLESVKLLEKVSPVPVDVSVESLADVSVEINDQAVVQSVINLCINSVEAMQKLSERSILIFVDEIVADESSYPSLKPGKYGRLSVVDHGIGFSAESKKRLFEPFFSTKPSAVGKAMGLSLSMAKLMMERSNGDLFVKTIENVGSVVYLMFPIVRGSEGDI